MTTIEKQHVLETPKGSSPGVDPYHALTAPEVLARVGADPQHGLAGAQVEELRSRFGFNELASAPPTPPWKKFLAQFRELVIWILIAAAAISAVFGEWSDALAISAIVLLNAILGFVQEEKAERALAALQNMSAPLAKTLRDGAWRSLPAHELLPGDVIELEAGDNVPADARLLKAFGLRVQEASLTGESTPVGKEAEATLPPSTPLADRRNMVYMGTIVASGKATAAVAATGMNAELGRIAGLLQSYQPEPTPLQRRLAELGRVLIVVCLALVGVIFLLQLLQGEPLLEVFMVSVGLAVAAVPEGLPAVVTIALALGLQRMVRRNALIRKLPSVETLGCVTVICSDKTGTLTRNEMTVREILVGGRRYQVTAVGYSPHGEFLAIPPAEESPSEAEPPSGIRDSHRRVDPHDDPNLMRLLEIGAWCNHARLTPQGKGGENWQIIGDPTEGALVVAARKAGVEVETGDGALVYEIPFDSQRKAMSVVVRSGDGSLFMYTKGAPEVILEKCDRILDGGQPVPLDSAGRQRIIAANSKMASRALRVLALAYRPVNDAGAAGYSETNLIFAGQVGMIDPPREEAKEAVRKCHDAGIRPVMITGDHPATALAVAHELNIASPGDEAVTGQQLDALSEADLVERVERIPVYARVSAEHKLRVVQAWKSRGQVVAMTGDGVNDAPAVKAADIGVAMGLTGTDVTKEASDMVLTDDNFASIVNAVEEGRSIFDNIQNVLQYLLSCNFGEILLMLAASLLGWPAPLLPIQLLWINLVTDGLPALALSLEPPAPGIMRRRPRSARRPMLSWDMGLRIVLQGTLVGGVALAAFGILYLADPTDVGRARTTAFCVLVYAELLRALAARSRTLTVAQLGFFTNPALLGAIAMSALLQLSVATLPFAQDVFKAATHFGWEWGLIALLAVTPLTVIELTKGIIGRFAERRQPQIVTGNLP